MNCPKCGKEYNTGETECSECGIFFEKYNQRLKKLFNEVEESLKENNYEQAINSLNSIKVNYPEIADKCDKYIKKIGAKIEKDKEQKFIDKKKDDLNKINDSFKQLNESYKVYSDDEQAYDNLVDKYGEIAVDSYKKISEKYVEFANDNPYFKDECDKKCNEISSIVRNINDKLNIKEDNTDESIAETSMVVSNNSSIKEIPSPGISVIFYILSVLSFIGGIVLFFNMRNYYGFSIGLIGFISGVVEAALFAAIGKGLVYLNQIAINTSR